MVVVVEPPVKGAPVTARPGVEAAPVALKMFAALNVCAIPRPAMVAEMPGNVMVVESVPASVRLELAVSVLPSRMVKVDPVAGAVRVTLFIVVTVATPRTGVTRVGEVSITNLVPVPV